MKDLVIVLVILFFLGGCSSSFIPLSEEIGKDMRIGMSFRDQKKVTLLVPKEIWNQEETQNRLEEILDLYDQKEEKVILDSVYFAKVLDFASYLKAKKEEFFMEMLR